MNLEDFLEEKQIKNRDIMMIHLSNGNTLEETARLYGVTRERVRQILKRICNKIKLFGGVREEKYIHLMQYDFTEEKFSKIFNEKKYVYYYRNYVLFFRKLAILSLLDKIGFSLSTIHNSLNFNN